MLLAFLIYNDGIGTIIRMATIYGTEIGIDQTTMIVAIMIVQFVGIPFSFLFGMLAGIGSAPSDRSSLGLVAYMAICVFGYSMTHATRFRDPGDPGRHGPGGNAGLAADRSSPALIPRDKSGEYFGFFGVAEKFAGILGPGSSYQRYGSSRNSDPGDDRVLRGRRGALALCRRRERPAPGASRTKPRVFPIERAASGVLQVSLCQCETLITHETPR